ncbi:hypothetical protein CDAR_383641 [Caerostris darwini]|uniref:Uncharacterized protein n=1 Tax=Caerostris darwini TaxID=1538125 RepID=A0AAV4SZF2_9ARAC|nr:hypothetical protein CDAR_383641 [Caerostris darwini]
MIGHIHVRNVSNALFTLPNCERTSAASTLVMGHLNARNVVNAFMPVTSSNGTWLYIIKCDCVGADEFAAENLFGARTCRENKLFYSWKDAVILKNFARNKSVVYNSMRCSLF